MASFKDWHKDWQASERQKGVMSVETRLNKEIHELKQQLEATKKELKQRRSLHAMRHRPMQTFSFK